MEFFENIFKIIEKFGLGQGLIIILILGLLYFLYNRQNQLYTDIISSKDNEIKRLVEDNKSLRNAFISLIKEKLDIPEKDVSDEESENLDLKEIKKSKK